MMNTLVATGLFTGYKVGTSDSVFVTHFQFTDDTM